MSNARQRTVKELMNAIEQASNQLNGLKDDIEKQGITQERYQQEKQFEQTIRELYLELATTYDTAGRKRDALVYYKSCSAFGHESRYIHLRCALIYKSLGRTDEAVWHLNKIVKLDNGHFDYPQAYYHLADIEYKKICYIGNANYSLTVIPYLIYSAMVYQNNKGYTQEDVLAILNDIPREQLFIAVQDYITASIDIRIKLLEMCLDTKTAFGKRFDRWELTSNYKEKITVELTKRRAEKARNEKAVPPVEEKAVAIEEKVNPSVSTWKMPKVLSEMFAPKPPVGTDKSELGERGIELESAPPAPVKKAETTRSPSPTARGN